MGCDGGTIPTRDELVKTRKKPEQKDRTADMVAKWKHCAISQEPLVQPIMACELGRLYNKESALEMLLDRSKFECAASFSHLKSLKDLRQLNLTANRGYDGKQAEKGNCYIDTQASVYICPVSGLELNGTYRFCFPWTCGCVISERALKEVPSDVCHKCGEKFIQDDLVVLNPPEDELDTIRQQMEARRLRFRRNKKSRKAEKHKMAADASDTVAQDGPTTGKKVQVMESASEKNNLVNGTSASGSVTTDVMSKASNGKTEDRATKQVSWKIEAKSAKQANGKMEKKSSKLTNGKTEDKLKGIQDDPSTSKVYKSLFTTTHKAMNQQKPHWVTFNPLYF